MSGSFEDKSGGFGQVNRSSTQQTPQSQQQQQALSLEGMLMQLRNTFLDFTPPTVSSVPRAATMPNIQALAGEEQEGGSPSHADALFLDFDPMLLASALEAPSSSVETSMVSPPAAATLPKTQSSASLVSSEWSSPGSGVVGLVSIGDEDGGKGESTTLMLRNLPNKLSQMDIVNCLNAHGFNGLFDFFYAPLDFSSTCLLGYAFVNFTAPEHAHRAWHKFKGERLVLAGVVGGPALKSNKTCEVSWARIQGLEANLKHYRNSPVNELAVEFRPMRIDPTTGRVTPFESRGTAAQQVQAYFQQQQPRSPKMSAVSSFTSTRTTGGHPHGHRSPNTTSNGRSSPGDSMAGGGGKLFVGGLAPETTSMSLRRYFEKFGVVDEAVVMANKDTGVSRGFGFCTFRDTLVTNRVLHDVRNHFIDGIPVAVRSYTSK